MKQEKQVIDLVFWFFPAVTIFLLLTTVGAWYAINRSIGQKGTETAHIKKIETRPAENIETISNLTKRTALPSPELDSFLPNTQGITPQSMGDFALPNVDVFQTPERQSAKIEILDKKDNAGNIETRVRINGQDFGPYEGYVLSAIASPSGHSLIAYCISSPECYIEIDAKKFGPYIINNPSSLWISDLHWGAIVKQYNNPKDYLVYDGEKVVSGKQLFHPAFSDGHWAVFEQRMPNARKFIYFDGAMSGPYEIDIDHQTEILDNELIFSFKDRNREVTHRLEDGTVTKWPGEFLAVGKKIYGPFNGMGDEFGRKFKIINGKLAFIYEIDREYFVFVNGKTYGPYDHAGDLFWYRDGFAFRFETKFGRFYKIVKP